MPTPEDLRNLVGGIDIYLFDQVLKDRLPPGIDILDAGCGSGRNLVWFLRGDYRVWGVDADPVAVAATQALATSLGAPADRFRAESLDRLSFADAAFDAVLSIAVLHFARNYDHFEAMVRELWRVLKPGGVLFGRLASSIGIESLIVPRGDGRFLLPDGTERFLVNEGMLLEGTRRLGARPLERIKTVNVENLRAMTTWVLRKN
ncbi:MAG: class I SAM-dependent methyltransferase [Planctomycetaceae bacterium]